jgi:hypothetical protein
MKLKNLAAALLLATALSVNIYAGDLQTPGYVPPPPPATITEDTETAKTQKTETETQEPTLADEFWVDALITLLSLY